MQRILRTRVLRAVLALWFVGTVGGQLAELCCPSHTVAVESAVVADEHAAHSAHAVPAIGGEDGSEQHGRHDGHSCTCPGDCSVASISTLEDRVAFAPAILLRSEAAAIVHQAVDPAVTDDWVLPPSMAPPSASKA